MAAIQLYRSKQASDLALRWKKSGFWQARPPLPKRSAHIYHFAGVRTLRDCYFPVARFLSRVVRFSKAPAHRLIF